MACVRTEPYLHFGELSAKTGGTYGCETHMRKANPRRSLDFRSLLNLVINKEYTARIDKLREQAGKLTHDTGNPLFRSLQILERLRR